MRPNATDRPLKDRDLRQNRQATVGGAVRGVDFVHATAESVDEVWSKLRRRAGRCAQADGVGRDLVACRFENRLDFSSSVAHYQS